MNRKQVLKNMKKNKKMNNTEEESNYVNSFVFAILILIIFFILGYLFIGIFVTKTISFGDKKDKKKEEITIDNDTILLGQLFEQSEDEYYVLVYDASDKDNILTNWKGKYESKGTNIKVYTVDSSNKLNAKFLVDKDSNTNPTGYDNLKVKEPTLIKISNKTVSEYIEGKEDIKNTFKK